MAAYNALGRWLLDEAASGTSPTTAADETGNGNTLTVDYGSSDANWTSATEGRGVDFTAAAATDDSAVLYLSDIATNGNIGSGLDSANQVYIVLQTDNIVGHVNAMRVLAVGTTSGNTDVSIIKTNSNWEVRWDQESGGANDVVRFDITQAAGRDTLIFQLDLTEAVLADRIKIYHNGTTKLGAGAYSSNNLTLNSTLGNINSTDRLMTIGNRGSRNRNPQGQIYYAEIGSGLLTASEISDIYTAVSSDNDASWETVAGTVTGTLSATEASDTAALLAEITVPVSISTTEDSDTASLLAEMTVLVSVPATEISDTAVILAASNRVANISATEDSDIAALLADSTVPVTAPISATELPDTVVILAGISIPVSSSIAAAEVADALNAIADVGRTSSISATEIKDTCSSTTIVTHIASISSINLDDTMVAIGSGSLEGTVSLLEGDDVADLQAATRVLTSVLYLEGSDTASLSASVSRLGDVVVLEESDHALIFAGSPLLSNLIYTEAGDRALFTDMPFFGGASTPWITPGFISVPRK